MRTDFVPAELPGRRIYQLLTSLVVPRPIAWISTVSPRGVPNLAPHSFFTVACAQPPIVQFTSVGRKDSLRNAEETGEFVVNFAPTDLQEEINATATDFPADMDEFTAAGLTPESSTVVTPPRVAASPSALECRLHSTVPLGDSTVVLGEVVHIAVAEETLVDGLPEITRLRPVSRLGKNEWGTIGEVTSLDRIRYSDWPAWHTPQHPTTSV
ncbi:flavin reductase family protein [Lipingzhangella sp. LS1_29]|uniref:Flavin reductase family protein n=1 Tax=Lipingzhangella rawalii TaxID=2055835 RepID=A0ABU2H132_9ACTN|nr:flavin reductase family protein [Lipingzhangella rawalii]MDS1269011.1 flavin reductase family protein [Lipingzhangella rawalii]